MSDLGSNGLPMLQTRLSRVESAKDRLTYCGYDIRDLAGHVSFEQVAFLLWHGELSTSAELAALKDQLALARTLPDPTLDVARALPATTDPLDAIRTLVSALDAGQHLRTPDLPQVIALTARLPLLVAAFDRLRRGYEPITARPDLDTAANYLYLLKGESPSPESSRALDTYLVLMADQALNTSTFAARVVASTRSDLCSAVVAALGALKGPLHGGTPARVLDMLQAIGTLENAEPWMRQALARGERLMGFGQHLYARVDPRAEILRRVAQEVSAAEAFALASHIEATGLRLLNDSKREQPFGINVEFYAAVLLQQLGLTQDLFAATFAISRMVGWGAHILEQVSHNRLIRPTAKYVGPEPRPLNP